MEIIVMYEPGTGPGGTGAPVRRVHAAPGAPGAASTPGPRTVCGKDTFAMESASWRPSEHPGSPWYPPEYADRVCDDCAGVMEDGT